MASSATVRQCGGADRCVDQASSDATRGRHGEGTGRGQAIPAWFSVMQIVLGAAITHPGATAVSRS